MSFREETIGECRLILGDAREVLEGLPKVDALVTDPPYGIGESSKHFASRSKLASAHKYERLQWDDKTAPDVIDAAMRCAKHYIIFGGNYYDLPPTSCWLVWDKENGENHYADCELAWTNLPKAVRRLKHMWHGMLRKGNEQRGFHPTQKPVGVMEWCINHLPGDAQTILDPFMGSGTTGVACVNLGRKFIGIEIEEKYFDIACRRIEEAYKQPRLFDEPAPKPEQTNLFDGDAA